MQGEGKLAGTPSVFLRTSGCNLRCSWCDSAYTSWDPEGEERELDGVVEEVRGYGASHVVVTGGEPLLQPEIQEACSRLSEDHHVTIETNATVYKEVEADLMSLSPKLSNSTPTGEWREIHEDKRLDFEVMERYIEGYDYQLKFVVAEESDVEEVDEILNRLAGYDRDKVLLMPEGVEAEVLMERGEWVSEVCKERGFRYSPRLQIHLYGNKRGT